MLFITITNYDGYGMTIIINWGDCSLFCLCLFNTLLLRKYRCLILYDHDVLMALVYFQKGLFRYCSRKKIYPYFLYKVISNSKDQHNRNNHHDNEIWGVIEYIVVSYVKKETNSTRKPSFWAIMVVEGTSHPQRPLTPRRLHLFNILIFRA